ncbi:hypothetical protein LP419_02605 [Massilia sp. H-1]|nr:hypothetical protein LP419_02605 [Massilia sp. H-1]
MAACARAGLSIVLLIALAALYRSGDGRGWMSTQWWGILGCIGWAYLAASLIFLLAQARRLLLAAAIVACVALFAFSAAFDVLHVSAMHATHTSIALAGVLCTLLLFDLGTAHPAPVRLGRAALLALSLAGAGAAAPGLAGVQDRRHAAMGPVQRGSVHAGLRPAVLADRDAPAGKAGRRWSNRLPPVRCSPICCPSCSVRS